MAKITLDTITSAYASTSLFQSNFSAIETELNDKVLYRVNPAGEANQMMNDLDMNSNDILNVNDLNTTSLTVNGTAITPNTNDQTLTYIDTEFTTQAGEDTFLAAYTVGFVDVYINGVLLADADYTATNGTSVVLTSVVALDTDVITVRAFSAFSAGDGITQTTADARYLLEANNLSDLNSASTSRTNLGLGTAATADVQTSSTDTTADALMVVGAAGLLDRTQARTTLDFNTLDIGIHAQSITLTGSTNSPPTSELFGILSVYPWDNATGARQDFMTLSATPEYWTRGRQSSIWSAWQLVYTGANYQPEEVGGIGVVKRMRSQKGSNIAIGESLAGSLIRHVTVDSTGSVVTVLAASGTWKNVSGIIVANLEIADFVRTA